jgi:rhamnose transport system substrate-binding protein
VQAISVRVLDASSLEPVMAAAKAKGIVIHTSVSDAPKSGRPAYVAQASDQGLG